MLQNKRRIPAESQLTLDKYKSYLLLVMNTRKFLKIANRKIFAIYLIYIYNRSRHWRCSVKKGSWNYLENVGKPQCRSLFFNKVAEAPAQVLVFKNTYCEKHVWTAALIKVSVLNILYLSLPINHRKIGSKIQNKILFLKVISEHELQFKINYLLLIVTVVIGQRRVI